MCNTNSNSNSNYQTTVTYFFLIYCREFSLLLREDPTSVFATDMQIENSEGPVDYDISRVYSGKLEGNI